MAASGMSWFGIVRLGLVQTALGAIIVMTTSTLNRVMVVEMALPAMVPGILVAWHHALQVLRPRWGFGADAGRRATPFIVAGMAMLALGGLSAAMGTAAMAWSSLAGIGLALLGFTLIGFGAGACGTSLLVLLAKQVAPGRRVAAATIVWLMMIGGFAVTAGTAGHFLDPFTPERLVMVVGTVCAIAFLVAIIAVRGVETANYVAPVTREATKPHFRQALAEVWAEPQARLFAIFIFVSMLAYSAQDLILEPFAGLIFGLTPGESTKLSGLQNGGVFTGMVLIALIGSRIGTPQGWTIAGCIASAAALFGLVMAGIVGPAWPLTLSVFALGLANGVYAAAAIGSMMALAGTGKAEREGTRMGVWGASQAIAFGLGGTLGTVAVDATRAITGSPLTAYGAVFFVEGVLFLAAALLAARIVARRVPARMRAAPSDDIVAMASGRG